MAAHAGAAPGAPPRVVFVNRYYAPDISATSQMLTGIAETLAREGTPVLVVTSRLLYEGSAPRLAAREDRNGVDIWRVATTRFGRAGLPGRAIDYLTFYFSASIRLLRLVRRGDILVAKTDPPLLSLVGDVVCACRGALLVNWLQDVFPEVALRVGLLPLPGPLERALLWLRDRSLRRAAMNVVLGTRMRAYIASRGIAGSRIAICENWADGELIRPIALADSALRRALNLGEKFVAAYSGNLGRAHEVETLLGAAERLAHDPRFVFLMIGGGANMRALEAEVARRGLTSFRFLPYQPRAALADSLAAGDVHLVSLLPALEGLIVPSKLYGILAAGRPVVFIGDTDGEVARVLRTEGCGVAVRCEDSSALSSALQALDAEPTCRQDMGRRARLAFESSYSLAMSAARWTRLVEGTLESAPKPRRTIGTAAD